MRADAIRTFAGGYHRGVGPRKPFIAAATGGRVTSARILVGILGFGFAVAGIAVAWTANQLLGMAVVIVGAFLLILPFTRSHDEE